MRITNDFSMQEFCTSEYAERHGIVIVPTPEVERAIRTLVVEVLQPLRNGLGRPVMVNSGYRPPEVNSGIGGAKTSQHLTGEAADIRVPGMTPLKVCEWIEENGLPFDQLIHEFGRWVHVSIAMNRPRRGQTLTAYYDQRAKKTVYVPGLVPIPVAA